MRDFFGGDRVKVVEYLNADDSLKVHILSSADRPQEGVTSYATIDASAFDNDLVDPSGRPVRVEFVAACQANFVAMGDVMSSCVFNIATGEYSANAGIIFPDVIAINDPAVRMKHALLMDPWLWEEAPAPLDEQSQYTSWLQIVPVDDAEFSFARENGVDALVGLLDSAQIDVFDINRASAVPS